MVMALQACTCRCAGLEGVDRVGARLRPTRRGTRCGAAARPRTTRRRRAARIAGLVAQTTGRYACGVFDASSNGSGLNPRRRGRWNASPSWPIGPASPTGLPIFGAARPRSSGPWRPTGSSSGARSRSAGRPSGTSWPAGRRPPVAGPRPALCIPGPSRPIRTTAPAREALARLDRVDAERQLELTAHDEPWPSAAVVAAPGSPGTGDGARRRAFLHRRCRGRRPAIRLRQRRDALPPTARALRRRPRNPGLRRRRLARRLLRPGRPIHTSAPNSSPRPPTRAIGYFTIGATAVSRM